jgi:hypothetical protein
MLGEIKNLRFKKNRQWRSPVKTRLLEKSILRTWNLAGHSCDLQLALSLSLESHMDVIRRLVPIRAIRNPMYGTI